MHADGRDTGLPAQGHLQGLVVLNHRKFMLNATQDVRTCLRMKLMGDGRVLGRASSPNP
jgi:hypothetical protein